ncbi:hypothetical protein E2C01_015065 [Portunus trituberculatus]|uniref:Uncharacterized protein n=1 Tax=Portunus trituberculatus TaxID=210409 RepID=A0A5B7DLU5_PORTR|nr:hypothetical protein [Portunus trituberculatus]
MSLPGRECAALSPTHDAPAVMVVPSLPTPHPPPHPPSPRRKEVSGVPAGDCCLPSDVAGSELPGALPAAACRTRQSERGLRGEWTAETAWIWQLGCAGEPIKISEEGRFASYSHQRNEETAEKWTLQHSTKEESHHGHRPTPHILPTPDLMPVYMMVMVRSEVITSAVRPDSTSAGQKMKSSPPPRRAQRARKNSCRG